MRDGDKDENFQRGTEVHDSVSGFPSANPGRSPGEGGTLILRYS